MNYTIPAKPTTYKGVRYRSRLEAKWAAFFEICGISAFYEPFDLEGWTPDFLVPNYKGSRLLVEVKPADTFDEGAASKMQFALGRCDFIGWPVLFGLAPNCVWCVGVPQVIKRTFTEDWEPLWSEAHNLTRFHKEPWEIAA